VYLVICISFRPVVFMFGRLCHMCVMCQVYVRIILNSVCFYGLDMAFISDSKRTSCLSGVFEWAFHCILIGIFQFNYMCLLFSP
jgi:hypothetical protein